MSVRSLRNFCHSFCPVAIIYFRAECTYAHVVNPLCLPFFTPAVGIDSPSPFERVVVARNKTSATVQKQVHCRRGRGRTGHGAREGGRRQRPLRHRKTGGDGDGEGGRGGEGREGGRESTQRSRSTLGFFPAPLSFTHSASSARSERVVGKFSLVYVLYSRSVDLPAEIRDSLVD